MNLFCYESHGTDCVVAGWELSFVGDNLLEDTMLSGVSTMLSKFTTPTVFCLDFLVIEFNLLDGS